MLWSREQAQCHGSRVVSSEAETRSGGLSPSSEVEVRLRGCQAIERSGVLPEGAFAPRARRRLTQGAPWPAH
jgi:hypothetical protein